MNHECLWQHMKKETEGYHKNSLAIFIRSKIAYANRFGSIKINDQSKKLIDFDLKVVLQALAYEIIK